MLRSRIVSLLLVGLLLVISVTLTGAQQGEKPSNALPDLTPRVPEPKAKPKFRVEVLANDDELNSQAASYIKRELRSLGDVEIVYKGADWQLRVLAMENKLKNGRKTGYTVSVVVTRRFGNRYATRVDKVIKEAGASGAVDEFTISVISLAILANISYEYEQNYLLVGDHDSLDKICKKAVTNFDIEYLEPERKARVENVR